MDFKTFTDSDWDAFAGAEGWADGASPKIAEITITDYADGRWESNAVAVADAKGIEVFYVNENSETLCWRLELAVTAFFMNTIVRALPSRVTVEQLEEYGFKSVSV